MYVKINNNNYKQQKKYAQHDNKEKTRKSLWLTKDFVKAILYSHLMYE